MPVKTYSILVVDDNPDILDAITLVLEDEGLTVSTTDDYNFVADLKHAILPDLILLDVLLSGHDGRLIAKQLKSKPVTKHIPVIMVSAHPSAKQSAKSYGADDFLSKPFEISDLVKLVRKHLP